MSSPNAESENTLCTNSMLGQPSVCSTTTTTSSDENEKLSTTETVTDCHETSIDINKSTNESGMITQFFFGKLLNEIFINWLVI